MCLVHTTLFLFDCESNTSAYVNHTQIRSLNQPVVSNAGRVSCSRGEKEPLIGFQLMSDMNPPITCETRQPLRHAPRLSIHFTSLHTLLSTVLFLPSLRCRAFFALKVSIYFNVLCFLVFFSVRLLSVLRGHSVFSSPPQRPVTSDFEGF